MFKFLYSWIALTAFGLVLMSGNAFAAYFPPVYNNTTCTASSTTEIGKFSILSFSYIQSGCATSGYDTVNVGKAGINLYSGNTISWTGFTPNISEHWGLWIDFNSDGDFSDPGEFLDSSTTATKNYSGFIKIPATASLGKYRMRVRCVTNSLSTATTSLHRNDACTAFNYGGTQDYTVNIVKQNCTDAGISNIISPKNAVCGDSNTQIIVMVKNFGFCPLSKVPVYIRITGSGTLTLVDTIKRTILPGKEDTMIFAKTLNTFNGNAYTILATTLLAKDSGTYNDTLIDKISLLGGVSTPSFTSTRHCGNGKVKLKLAVSNGYNIFWYSSATSPVKIATGDTFTTPYLSGPTTYYASATTAFPYTVGPKSLSSLGSAANTSSVSSGLVFNALFDFSLDSLAVYPNGSGNVVINLEDSNGVVLQSDTNAVNPASAGARVSVPVGMFILKGRNYRLTATGSTTGGLWYNTKGAVYPFYVPGVVSIKDNSTGTSGAYYFFYDWQITGSGCYSRRVPVKANILYAPTGMGFTAGKPFSGIFNSGTAIKPDSVCAGDTLNYVITPPTGLTNAGFGTDWKLSSYSIRTASGLKSKDTILMRPSASGNGSFTFFPAKTLADSTFILSMTFSNAIGCDTIIKRYIYVNKPPKANFSFNSACANAPLSFTNTTTAGKGGITYSWDFGDGGNSTLANPKHTYLAGGTYKVILTAKATIGCMDTFSQMVTVYYLPVVKFNALPVCFGSPSIFMDSSSVKKSTISSYYWDFGDTATSTSSSAPTHTYLYSGIRNARLTLLSAQGCRDSAIRAIYANPHSKPDFSFAPVCARDSMAFTNKSKISTGTLSYIWHFGDNDTSSALNPKHLYKKGGSYNVSLAAISSGGCTDSVKYIASVFVQPVGGFYFGGICLQTPVQFTDTSTVSSGSIKTFEWEFGDSSNSKSRNPKHQYLAKGAYRVSLRATTDKGCFDTLSKLLTIDSLRATFTSTGACENGYSYFKNTNLPPKAIVAWHFGDGDSSFFLNPNHIYKKAGSYNVQVKVTTQPAGCVTIGQKNVVINPLPDASFKAIAGANCVWAFSPTILTHTSYKWAFGDGDSATTPATTHKYKDKNSYTINLSVRSSQGCQGNASVFVKNCTDGVEEPEKEGFRMKVFPNPFETFTNLTYYLPKPSEVKVTISDINGRIVSTLVPWKHQQEGEYFIKFDAHAANLSSGVYVLKLEIDGLMLTKEIIRIK